MKLSFLLLQTNTFYVVRIQSRVHVSFLTHSLFDSIISRKNNPRRTGRCGRDRDAGARYVQSSKSVEAGLEVSRGYLILNYDVDKTLEDMSQEISTFRYHALSRVSYTR